MKYIVYADIHHDDHAAKCLTLKDTLEIERQIFNRSAEGGFDFVLFCGDRFLKREPKDEVKVMADQVIFEGLQKQKAGFGYFHLVGNHDRVDNTLNWHTAQSLGLSLKRDSVLPGIMDEPTTYSTPSLPVRVHALPAGYSPDFDKYSIDPGCFNIFAFHDIVVGSTSDEAGKHIFDSGITLSDIDKSEFDIVYGGDIHVPQTLNFKNTKGGYVGSVLQRTRADSNRPRGWLEVEVEHDGSKWVTKTTFVPTRNFFSRFVFDVDEKTTYDTLTSQIDDVWVSDQAVEVRLRGSKADVDRLAEDGKWKNYTSIICARHFDVLREYQSETSAETVDMSASVSPMDDFDLYLESGFAEVGTLSRETMSAILEEACQTA